MPDFSQYQPPGVYVNEAPTSLVNVTGITPTVIGIVGPAIGFRVATESPTLHGTTTYQLAALGITSASIVVTDVTGHVYVSGTDYAIVQTAGTQAGSAYQTTTIARIGGGTLADGTTVFVNYQYTDANYYTLQRFTNFEDVKDHFGQPLDLNSNAILSPLSLAAQVAFENGAQTLVLVPTSDAVNLSTRAGLQAGLNLLNAAYDVNIVVPLPVGIVGTNVAPGDTENVALDLKNHCDIASANGLYRVGFIGLPQGASITPDVVSKSIVDKRVHNVWPNAYTYYNGYNNKTFVLDGLYAAAAVAGSAAGQPPQMPLTKKKVNGFSGIPAAIQQTMTATYKNSLSSAGVLVIEPTRNGNLVVRHGVTTDPTNVQTRETSLVRAKDALVNLVHDTIDASGIIGTPIDSNTIGGIKGLVTGALEYAKSNNLINDYSAIGVRQQNTDPTIVEVKFNYKPAYPLNYIVVTFSIDTTTGSVTAA